MTNQTGGDELWDSFVKEFEKQNAPHEPSAAERALPQPRRRRRWPWVALTLAGCLLAGGAGAYRLGYLHPAGHASAATAVGTAAPSASAGRTAAPDTAAKAAAPAGRAASEPGTATAVTPAQAFPAAVAGYTRVSDTSVASCTGAQSVGPTLAGLITQSHGCLGLDFALYRDRSADEYSFAVFTMRSPEDVLPMITRLGGNPTDDEVVVQLPPPGSALRSLPASSGLVQAFAGTGNLMVVGMAQWSDGHSGDYQRLEDDLAPLLKAVTAQAGSSSRSEQ
ncbi:hypothetical protein GXW83_18575 [Streptacidiphilus sp. PB12-B1b]|uniref:hypothetical protein n=1 Tax=Streptacidiphilus sp. PB12-B1b TaxID=2705012 RepID=UPI0015F9F87F|nr:hypothetical protein [Streptacidiphilus sp. PB12-B1b]QMU77404.1 hypothetical protein GXW83_18575 [Streptacidiphilus sp. PB12-B1b]